MLKFIVDYIESISNEDIALRPPGAVPEKEFLNKCIKCNKCLQICPYDSIVTAGLEHGRSFGTPIVKAREVPCYLCMLCPPVCPTGALDNNLLKKEEVKMGVAVINEQTCLPYNGIICRACFENCPIFRKAIILEDEMYPKVVEEHCVGCGICERVCPVESSAIIVKSNHHV
ncbi:MAG: 4Fe-4S dicluster domain-containing protein [Ignavibacteriae bacterium]|jgi:MauM/NapG family ferredoxin protein|nr:4Fe-4S dicluster domain-containing protein [Ignavibacteriota bacterium]NOG96439.1 4Fe-4S dicluster domain-containing protein [Ignavibacteriota bacterium]